MTKKAFLFQPCEKLPRHKYSYISLQSMYSWPVLRLEPSIHLLSLFIVVPVVVEQQQYHYDNRQCMYVLQKN